MSLRHEQYHSLQQTRQFMFDMLDTKRRPKTVKEMKGRVRRCLRHYPFLKMSGEPLFSKF